MGETCCLRLMQADGMNDNLSGKPAMPPPTGTTVSDREEITDRHPSAHLAAGMEITAGTRLPSSQQEWESHTGTPMPIPQQERESQQPPVFLLPTTTDIARQLSRLPWRYFFYIKV